MSPVIIRQYNSEKHMDWPVDGVMQMLPAVQAMATNVLVRQGGGGIPRTNPQHGMVAGSPEHDICTAPSFFFSINIWFVRGLLSLA